MNLLFASGFVRRQSLIDGLNFCLVASILLAGAGCQIPAANSIPAHNLPSPIRRVQKPIVKAISYVESEPTGSTKPNLTENISISVQPMAAKGTNYASSDSTTPSSNADTLPSEANQGQIDPLLDNRTSNVDFIDQLGRDRPATLWGRLWDDQKNFYSPESLTLLGGGLIVGGAMANSSIDDGIHRHFQSSVRGATSDDWFESLHASKELGNGMYTLPVFATAWAAGELFPESELVETGGRWGERSMRGFLVGAPPLIVMQQLTGGSRPTETDESSEWHPLRDNNGVSGHAFMGSLPFITAAKMTENRGYKFLFYAGSTVAPLSRVNDNAHYPSQVALGWWMAYLAASAIDSTDNPNARWRFYPSSTDDAAGMLAEFRF